ncbi:putative gustatory receptor 77a isoform X1 [Drosophila erecta]|uniref:putative gustatory receptor 77a isoform X1 n=1 Tax=Drosophila erecta TaxID=7220 RepID=UPI000F04B98C|nr:putative gustatory receptor 77a isoform X1 [Drosophila erecta]
MLELLGRFCRRESSIHKMHYYGLYLKNVDHIFAVSACGLFKLNNALLFCIVGAILEYLMILIQFDKVLNQ